MIRGGELKAELKKSGRKSRKENGTAAFYSPADLEGIQGPRLFIYFGTGRRILWG